jgi:hypothetical protein
MSILTKLASASGKKDKKDNVQLAAVIVQKKDTKAINELADNLYNKQKGITHDCIKVLYEIGEQDPELIQEHITEFIQLLDSKDNRMQWGAMTALHYITSLKHTQVFKVIEKIVRIADAGSVITRDHCVGILVKLAVFPKYEAVVMPLLVEQLSESPVNQLPMYAEQVLPVVKGNYTKVVFNLLSKRLDEVEQESKRKRITKVLSKFKV